MTFSGGGRISGVERSLLWSEHYSSRALGRGAGVFFGITAAKIILLVFPPWWRR